MPKWIAIPAHARSHAYIALCVPCPGERSSYLVVNVDSAVHSAFDWRGAGVRVSSRQRVGDCVWFTPTCMQHCCLVFVYATPTW